MLLLDGESHTRDGKDVELTFVISSSTKAIKRVDEPDETEIKRIVFCIIPTRTRKPWKT
jgi:hypothetical protein